MIHATASTPEYVTVSHADLPLTLDAAVIVVDDSGSLVLVATLDPQSSPPRLWIWAPTLGADHGLVGEAIRAVRRHHLYDGPVDYSQFRLANLPGEPFTAMAAVDGVTVLEVRPGEAASTRVEFDGVPHTLYVAAAPLHGEGG